MYSYEDRIRAVELYIKLGKRVRPTIRQLGYPTKNSLKGWYNEYQQKLDLSAGYAGREPKFSQAQKATALEHYLTHDRCIAATMRALYRSFYRCAACGYHYTTHTQIKIESWTDSRADHILSEITRTSIR